MSRCAWERGCLELCAFLYKYWVLHDDWFSGTLQRLCNRGTHQFVLEQRVTTSDHGFKGKCAQNSWGGCLPLLLLQYEKGVFPLMPSGMCSRELGVVIGRELNEKVHVGFLQVMMKRRVLRGAWPVLEQENEGELQLGQCWGSWGGLHKRHASPVFSPWTLAPGEKRNGKWALFLWLLSARPVLIRGCLPDTGQKSWGESRWGTLEAVCRRKEESWRRGGAPPALRRGRFLAADVAQAPHPQLSWSLGSIPRAQECCHLWFL